MFNLIRSVAVRGVARLAALVIVALGLAPAAMANSFASPTPIVIPSVVPDEVGSAGSAANSYFSFVAVAGTSYAIAPERIDPATGELYGPASFQVQILTNDSARQLVAQGTASNLVPFITPPLQNGGYIILIRDGLVGYTFAQTYYLRTSVASVGGTPFGPVPGSAAPAALSSLSPGTARIRGGTSITYTVALSAPAPAGGALVSLSSSSAVASLPASVLVPQGATSATFQVNTATVSRNATVTLTARAGTLTRTATLTVTR